MRNNDERGMRKLARSRSWPRIWMSCNLALAATVATAQPGGDRIEPDRRDFTTGTGIAESGRVQLESGGLYTRSDDERLWRLGEWNVRLPLSSWAEMHIRPPSYLVRRGDRHDAGFDDLGVEARLRILKREYLELGLQVGVMLPTGSRGIAERYGQPSAVMAATLRPSDDTAVVLNIGGSRASQDGQHFTQGFAAASFRIDVTSTWNVFAETYGFNREKRGGSSRRYAAIGAVYFIGKSTALDVRVGTGIRNGDGTTTLASAGLSNRF